MSKDEMDGQGWLGMSKMSIKQGWLGIVGDGMGRMSKGREGWVWIVRKGYYEGGMCEGGNHWQGWAMARDQYMVGYYYQ